MTESVDVSRIGLASSQSGVADPRLARALKLALDPADRAARMSELASRAGMSRSAFAKRFADEAGMPAMQFVRTQRLRYAAHLLAATSKPVKAIAALAGYASRSQFCRAFQRQYGESPSDFRERPARIKETLAKHAKLAKDGQE